MMDKRPNPPAVKLSLECAPRDDFIEISSSIPPRNHPEWMVEEAERVLRDARWRRLGNRALIALVLGFAVMMAWGLRFELMKGLGL